MYRSALCVLLLTASCAFAQAPQQNPTPSPSPCPDSGGQQQSSSRDQEMSDYSSRIQRSVQDLLEGDPLLNGADIQTTVDNDAITLSGTVDGYMQHQRVIALVNQYTRFRRIVDKLQTR